MVRVPEGEVMGLACPGMASSHSSDFAVRGHHRARANLGFSTCLRCCRRRYKTASLKALANSERASNRDEVPGFYGGRRARAYRRSIQRFSSFFPPSSIPFAVMTITETICHGFVLVILSILSSSWSSVQGLEGLLEDFAPWGAS